MKLNLGCGLRREDGYVNIDKEDYDFNDFPWIHRSNTFEEIRIWNSIHCCNNLNKFMAEVWRVAKPKAKILIKSQYHLAPEVDPMTKTPICFTSFNQYRDRFKIIKRRWIFTDYRYLSWLNFIPNIFPKFYCRFLYFYFPSDKIYFELEVIK